VSFLAANHLKRVESVRFKKRTDDEIMAGDRVTNGRRSQWQTKQMTTEEPKKRSIAFSPFLATCSIGGSLGVMFFVGLAFFQLRNVSIGWIGYTDEYLVLGGALSFIVILFSLLFQPNGRPVTRSHLARNLWTSIITFFVCLVNVAFIEATFSSKTVQPHTYALLTLTVAGIALPAGSTLILSTVDYQSAPKQKK
jgi:hypothetical protein